MSSKLSPLDATASHVPLLSSPAQVLSVINEMAPSRCRRRVEGEGGGLVLGLNRVQVESVVDFGLPGLALHLINFTAWHIINLVLT